MKKRFTMMFLICLCLIISVETVYGMPISMNIMKETSIVRPYYDNCSLCSPYFSINNGDAIIRVDYRGIAGNFIKAKVMVEVQKKSMGLFWTNIDIGEPNNIWVQESYNISDILEKTFIVDLKGTYRAKFYIEFYGNSGVVDTIEKNVEAIY